MTNRMPDPTPEEIRQLCEEIQAGWTEEMRQRRKFGSNSEAELAKWEAPEFKVPRFNS